MRRPAVSLALGAVLLLAIAAPALTMRSGGFSADSFPQSYTSKRGLDMLKRDFAAGMSEPTTVVVDGDLGRREGAGRRSSDFVARARRGRAIHRDRRLDQRRRFAGGGPDDPGRRRDVARGPRPVVLDLRDTLAPEAFDGTGAEVYVGGTTAAQIDSVDLTDGYMPIVIGTVLLLSFVLLLLAFRSVVVAATAILMNLLSVGAAYGALTLVFQHGLGRRAAGPDPGWRRSSRGCRCSCSACSSG